MDLLPLLKIFGFVDLFTQYLSDATASVSRETTKALGKRVHLLEGERIWHVFTNTASAHSRRNSLFLIARLGKWESITYLIEALCTEAEELRELAKKVCPAVAAAIQPQLHYADSGTSKVVFTSNIPLWFVCGTTC
ncbi:MAG TPA: hypothetical protein VJW20_24055 [Candidatus Angelobacter sp.]|nr:hypothetical protein [Candidatus Angelobacter sp.]